MIFLYLFLLIIYNGDNENVTKTVAYMNNELSEFDIGFTQNDKNIDNDSLLFISIMDFQPLKHSSTLTETKYFGDSLIIEKRSSDILFYDNAKIKGAELKIIEELLTYKNDERICVMPVRAYLYSGARAIYPKEILTEIFFSDTNIKTGVINYDTIKICNQATTAPFDYKTECKYNSLQVFALFLINQVYYGEDYSSYSSIPALAYESEQKNNNIECQKGKIVEQAYKAYESWFNKISISGIKEARKLKVNPLDGSGIKWVNFNK